jgi:hypothetical protein
MRDVHCVVGRDIPDRPSCSAHLSRASIVMLATALNPVGADVRRHRYLGGSRPSRSKNRSHQRGSRSGSAERAIAVASLLLSRVNTVGHFTAGTIGRGGVSLELGVLTSDEELLHPRRERLRRRVAETRARCGRPASGSSAGLQLERRRPTSSTLGGATRPSIAGPSRPIVREVQVPARSQTYVGEGAKTIADVALEALGRAALATNPAADVACAEYGLNTLFK